MIDFVQEFELFFEKIPEDNFINEIAFSPTRQIVNRIFLE